MASRPRPITWRRTARGAVALAALLAGCAGDNDDSAPTTTTTTAPITATDSTPTTAASTTSAASDESRLPARPGANPGPGNPDDVWLGRGDMTDDSVGLFFAFPEGATAARLYRIDRPASGDAPDSASITDADLIHEGLEPLGFEDESVVTGEAYWYVLRVDLGAAGEAERWTPAIAQTDTIPPAPVTGLSAERVDDGVLLRWDEVNDERFGRYAIRRGVDGEASEYFGTSFMADRTSFLDDQLPDGGVVRYEVFAQDFHENLSEATVLELDLGT